MRNITFDLAKFNYADARSIEDDAFVHVQKMSDIERIWDGLFKQAKSCCENGILEDIPMCHNTISILASRGAGKTSFLLTFRERVKKNYSKEVFSLPHIDPSTMELKSHPFISIIASIQSFVQKEVDKDNTMIDSHRYTLKVDVDNSYRDLIMALPFIDGVGKEKAYSEWDDVEYASSKGMEYALASNDLRSRFNKYVVSVLKYLDKKVLFISFDDVDTDFTKGYQVLEIIRKYLNIPCVITVLTGDLELFSELIRKEYWAHFQKPYIQKEVSYSKRDKNEFSTLINQLENQYMIKILKPDYRIQLKTLSEYIEEKEISVSVKYKDIDSSFTIQECYSALAKSMCISSENKKAIDHIVSFMLNQTLRIQMRLLSMIKEEKDILSKDTLSDVVKKRISDRLFQIYWNDICQNSNNAKLLLRETNNYTIEVQRFLIFANLIASSTNFLPETGKDTLDKSLLVIGTKLNNLLSVHKSSAFEFWLRISYVRMMSERIGITRDSNSIDEFITFSQLGNDVNLTKSIGNAQAFCNQKLRDISLYDKESFIPGVVRLNSGSPILTTDYFSRISLMPMIGFLNKVMGETVVVSIYHLLSLIHDILKICDNESNESQKDKSELSDYLELQLNKLGQYRTYHEPVDEYSHLEHDDKDTTDEYHFVIADSLTIENLKKLSDEIARWASQSCGFVTCQLLDRIFVRFYYTLINIDNKHNYSNAAEALEQYVLAFLNSILVEESIEKNISPLIVDNHYDIENIYLLNYYQYTARKKKYQFFSWMSKCPLLKQFISPTIIHLTENNKNREVSFVDLQYFKNRNRLSLLQQKIDEETDRKKIYDEAKDWFDAFFEYKHKDIISKLSKELFNGIPVPGQNEYISISRDYDEILRIHHKFQEEYNQICNTIHKAEMQIDEINKKMKNIGALDKELIDSLESKNSAYYQLSKYEIF